MNNKKMSCIVGPVICKNCKKYSRNEFYEIIDYFVY